MQTCFKATPQKDEAKKAGAKARSHSKTPQKDGAKKDLERGSQKEKEKAGAKAPKAKAKARRRART